MAGYQTTIRDGCYAKILAAKPTLIITDFTLSKTYFPSFYLEEMGSTPIVTFTAVGMGSERVRNLRKAGIKQIQLGVICHVLRKIDDPKDNTDLDIVVEFVEQLMDKCEDDDLVSNADFNWMITEPLKDENGLIFDYEALTENGIFQAVFILHYTYMLQ